MGLCRKIFFKIKQYKLRKKYPWIYESNVVCLDARLDHKSRIKLGGNCYIGANCEFFADAGLKIGYTSIFGRECLILTSNHNYKGDELPYDNVGIYRHVEIGNYCWFGARCVILPGVKIEDGVVAAAGSVISKSVPRGAIVAGNPARIVGFRDMEKYSKLEAEHKNYIMGRGVVIVENNKFKDFLKFGV